VANDSGPFIFSEPTPKKYREFDHAIAEIDIGTGQTAVDALAAAWRRVGDADLALVWVLSDVAADPAQGPQFQLAGMASDDAKKFEGIAESNCTQRSMGALAVKLDEVQGAKRASEWSRQSGGESYKSTLADVFEKTFGTVGVVCVPLTLAHRVAKVSKEQSDFKGFQGVVSLHYTKPDVAAIFKEPDQDRKPDETGGLKTMGRVSAIFMENVWREQKILAAKALTTLANEHLARQRDDPRIVRRQFAEGVINLIRDQLGFQAVTIFGRVPFERRTAIIASTGIFSTTSSSMIFQAEYAQYGYAAGEGSVGKSYLDQRARVLMPTDPLVAEDERILGVTEFRPSSPGSDRGQTIVSPIPGVAERSQTSEASLPVEPVVAVIRCSCQKSGLNKKYARHIDAIQYETLEFVAEQIASVLLTFESRIMREDVISVVKHDLFVPLHSIRDAVDFLTYPPPNITKETLAYYWSNLQMMPLRLGGLVDQLSRDLLSKRRISPERTFIGAAIVAPLKRMMSPYALESNQAEIVFDGFEAVPPLNIDPSLIERAIYNLVVNGLKYGPRRDSMRNRLLTVMIRGSKVDGGYAIDVENEGDGVEPEAVPFLFTMHFRSRRARATREGTGLGLSVVRQIMVSHGGNASLLRAKDPTIFRLFFPDRLKS
jgi:signal transduction histidine kinase